ncbi:MAG: hypothetical protein IIT33_07890, partial [Prevotella sp.]|nr:hypothetical protein [Prevotella sp.]
INLHIAAFGCEDTHYLLYKRTIDAKCENTDAFCATMISKNRRTFAPSKQTTSKYEYQKYHHSRTGTARIDGVQRRRKESKSK